MNIFESLAGAGDDPDHERRTLQRIIRSLANAQRLAGLASWEWDLARDELWWSDEVFRLFGVEPRAFQPDYGRFQSFVHPDDRDRVHDIVSRSQTSEDGRYDAEYRIVRPDGTVRHVHAMGETTRDAAGELVRMLGTVLDVTERIEARDLARARSEQLAAALRQTEEAARAERRAQERERRFLDAVSHELRTPLTVLKGVAETLQQPSLPGETRAGLVRSLEAHVARLSELVDDLLLVSNETPLDDAPRVLVEASTLVVGTADPGSGGAEVRVTDVDDVLVLVEPRSIRRAVHAMVDNAVRYGGGAPVEVSCRAVGDDLRIEVADEGPGIRPDVRGDVFEPFARGDALVAHAPGTGVGLSIVRLCAELHDGVADIHDRAGGGAVVRLLLCGVRATR